MEDEKWLTIKQVAERLQLTEATIRKYMRNGKMPHYRQGNIVRLKKSEVDNFLRPSNKQE